MRKFIFALLLILTCSAQANAAAQVDPNAVLPVETLKIVTGSGEFKFSIEIADEPNEHQVGLMHRQTMLPTHGMMFEFNEIRVVNMWMKNTPLSLDMVFIKPDGTVERIARNTVPFSTSIVSSFTPVSHVLELNAGTALQIGLKPGDQLFHKMFNVKSQN